jgi:hypothetical protein
LFLAGEDDGKELDEKRREAKVSGIGGREKGYFDFCREGNLYRQ